MGLIERYLAAVRWNLPAAKAGDILAELQDVLASRIEDREAALGRPLTDAEKSALLRDFGHPLAVAGRYHGQRALIGPDVFPFYWFVLRIALAIVAVVEAVQLAARLVTTSQPFEQALMQGVHDAGQSLLLNGAICTLVFAVIERSGWLTSYLERWQPERLPALTLKMPVRRPWEAVFEIAAGIGFLLWWAGAVDLPVTTRNSKVAITLAPVWAGLFWPVAALIAGRILFNLVALLRPAWKAVRALLSVATAAGTAAIAALLYQAGGIVTVTPLSSDAVQAARMQESIDLSLHIALIAIPAIALIQCGVELWRIARQR